MSLPVTFVTDDDYFEHAVRFLCTYSWVYREANTACLTSLDSMPWDFKDYFLKLSNDDLNDFPFVHEPLAGCPEAVQQFRQQIVRLSTPATSNFSSSVPSRVFEQSSKHNRKISPKKLHEIEQLAVNIYDHCDDAEILLDLGSGLGYLSETLIKLKESYLILGLEADAKRVQTAQKRISQILPTKRLKSVKYKQEFVTADAEARARIEGYVSELAQCNGLTGATKMSLIGLHACADLSVSAMKLFLAMDQVQCLHIMPCCYHKLALEADSIDASPKPTPFVNFPLSNLLREAMFARSDISEVFSCFSRPFMRLSCQETKSRWRCESLTHTEHGAHMFYRGLATALCDADEFVKVKRNLDGLVKSPVPQTYCEFQQSYQLYAVRTKQPVDWRPIHEARFHKIIERYPEDCGIRLAEALRCLQASMQVISLFAQIQYKFHYAQLCLFFFAPQRSSARTWCSTTVCATLGKLLEDNNCHWKRAMRNCSTRPNRRAAMF